MNGLPSTPKTNSNKTGIYLHIPFCRSRCTYCEFYSCPATTVPDSFVKALVYEIQNTEFPDVTVETIYLGGGTPSLLTPAQLSTIFDALTKTFSLISAPEISIETNPESLSQEKLQHYRALGINRLTMGAQSLNDQVLRQVRRAHTVRELLTKVTLAANEIPHLGLDFIIGLPEETTNSWQQGLAIIKDLPLRHLSAYFLENDPPRWSSDQLPTEEQTIDWFESLGQLMRQKGFIHYEVSNWAAPGEECRYNLNTWRRGNYLGFGPSAHSCWNNRRWSNPSELKDYLNSPPSSLHSPFSVIHSLSPQEIRTEQIMLGLRTREGIDLRLLAHRDQLLKQAEPFLANQQLVLQDNCLRVKDESAWLRLDYFLRALV